MNGDLLPRGRRTPRARREREVANAASIKEWDVSSC
jgi:hypothetical protein